VEKCSTAQADLSSILALSDTTQPDQEGTTMTALTKRISVIWDFPVMVFNMGREKLEKIFANRDEDEGRWLNG
jgi:hypothetical protein